MVEYATIDFNCIFIYPLTNTPITPTPNINTHIHHTQYTNNINPEIIIKKSIPKYTPDTTIVDECSKEEIGEGASIAFSSQVKKGN